MSISYAPMIRFYRLPLLWAFSLPMIATFYAGATLHSAVQYWRGKGGVWKGRFKTFEHSAATLSTLRAAPLRQMPPGPRSMETPPKDTADIHSTRVQQLQRRLEKPTTRAHQRNLIDNHRRHVNLHLVMHRRLHDDCPARFHHGDRLLQPLGRTGGIHHKRKPPTRSTPNATTAPARPAILSFPLPSVYSYPRPVCDQYLSDQQTQFAVA